VPQDVDLEDRLIYGLTPVRFGYLVIAVLGALSCWHLELAPAPLRGAACATLLAVGALAAWGRWRGHPVDRLAWDLLIYCRRNLTAGIGGTVPWRGHPLLATPDLKLVVDLKPLSQLGRAPTLPSEVEPP